MSVKVSLLKGNLLNLRPPQVASSGVKWRGFREFSGERKHALAADFRLCRSAAVFRLK
jgi:hypothetical protein